uniref:Cytochrome P450 family 2 subfamily T member 1 n=1 Tax=Otolemur garnettii TaxID=30611 RepID=H0XTI9_OTOGA
MITGIAAALLLPLLVLALAWWSWGARCTQMRGALPPGPRPLPLLGNLLQLKPHLDRALMELSRHWGSVFTVRLGRRPAVVLCGYAALRDALVLQADTFSGRGAMPVFERFTHGNGIVFSNGPLWGALRNFALGALKEFGLGTQTIEEQILEEASCLLNEFQATIGTPFDPRRLLSNAVSNVICSVVFGKRYSYGDSEFLRLLDLFNDNFRIMSSRWGEAKPSVPSKMTKNYSSDLKRKKHLNETVLGSACGSVRRAQAQYTGSTQRWQVCKLEKPRMGAWGLGMAGGVGKCSADQLPLAPAKVQAELDAVVGRVRAPNLEDRACLPYTNAVLHEIQRFISVLPLGLPRALTRDTHLHGHFLPKGTFVIPLLVSAHRDPTQFKDPDCFNPTNFLNDKGEFQSNDAFMPFAPGKRMCLGAGLAHSEIFLFPTAILQKFSLLPVENSANINLTPHCTGLGNVPPAFQLRLVPR